MSEETVIDTQVAAPDNAALSSETPPENTGGVGDAVVSDTTQTDANGAETDEQKNKRVQQEEQQRAEKRSRGVQKRMDELTRDKYAERQARESLEKQNAELLAMLKGNTSKPTQSDGRPTQDQFQDFQEFVRADAVWHARQESVREARALLEENLKTQTQAQQRQAHEHNERTIHSAYVQRQREIAKNIPDFDETMSEGAQDITVPDPVFNMIRRMPNGPLIAYHLVKNPALTDQFYNSPPEMHGILLGQLSATLKGSAKVSNAPPPGTPVKAKTGSSSEPPEDTDAYMAWAEKNMR